MRRANAAVLVSLVLVLGTSLLQAAEIHDAVRAGELERVKALLEKDPKAVNEKDARGRTPLHFACNTGHKEIVAFLLSKGADVRAADQQGYTPLHWAAYAGRLDAIRLLLDAGADVNVRTEAGVTALDASMGGRQREVVEFLVEKGLRIETKGEAGRAMLHRAASGGYGKLVDWMLANGADPASKTDEGGTLLHSAASGGLTDLVKRLIEGGADMNGRDGSGQTPLHLSAASGRKETVEFLISKGADTKALCLDGRTLLHSAAAGGLVDIMERLLQAGFKVDVPDHYGRTPLFSATEGGSVASTEFLLSKGADVKVRDYDGSTPVHHAVFSADVNLLEALRKGGVEIDVPSSVGGATPLFYAAQAGRAEPILWLVDHGARLDARDSWGMSPIDWAAANGPRGFVETLYARAEALKATSILEQYPLHKAASMGQVEVAAFLLGKGAKPDLRDEDGKTPLHRAAQGGSVEVARMLVEKAAAVNVQDPEGSTPLHDAVKRGNEEMVRFLIEKGADRNARDKRGRSPSTLGAAYGYPEIVEILGPAEAEQSTGSGKIDPRSLLSGPLGKGEARIWYLGHCGYAVKTPNHLLIFDYWSRGPRPDKPSLANGFIDPEEIKDQDVTVFVTHDHPDHYDPTIFSWEGTVEKITYVLGWNAREGPRIVQMPGPRAKRTIGDMEIFTVNSDHNQIPEVGYLVKVDGLAIFHPGDYVGRPSDFLSDMEYLRKAAGRIDLEFMNMAAGQRQVEILKPSAAFPMHAFGREYMYGAAARAAKRHGVTAQITFPENKGDLFALRDGKISQGP